MDPIAPGPSTAGRRYGCLDAGSVPILVLCVGWCSAMGGLRTIVTLTGMERGLSYGTTAQTFSSATHFLRKQWCELLSENAILLLFITYNHRVKCKLPN